MPNKAPLLDHAALAEPARQPWPAIAPRTLADASPEFAKLNARLEDFNRARTDAAADRERHQERGRVIAQGVQAGRARALEDDVQKRRAAALVDGENPDDIESATIPESIHKAIRRESDLIAAVDVLKSRLAQERVRASRLIMDEIREPYLDLVASFAADCVFIAQKCKVFVDLVRACEAEGIVWNLPTAFPAMFNAANLSQSPFALYLRHLVSIGLWSMDDIPDELLDHHELIVRKEKK